MMRLIRLGLALAWLLAPIPAGAQVLSLTDGTAATSLPTLPFAAGTLAAPSLVFTGDVERGLYLQTDSVGIAGGAHITGPVTVTALATPGSITVTPQGTAGATTYTYKLVATVGGATTEAGAASSTATGNATLDGVNFNRLTWTAVAGATGYRIYRTVGGATQGLIATIALGATVTVDDTGLAGGGETAPTVNNTGAITLSSVAGHNTALGGIVLVHNTTGEFNTGIGAEALVSNTTGSINTGIGANALANNTTGGYNTALGVNAGYGGNGSNSLFLGYTAGKYETGSSKFLVNTLDQGTEAAERTNALLYGVFNATPASQTLAINVGTLSVLGLKTTGAATGKVVVCVDTATGILYASSTGTDCSN